MLHRLEIENFYSVDGQVVLDLPVAANAPDPDGRFATPLPGIRIPKCTVLFGANGSGKTTILRAVAFLKHFMAKSFDGDPAASIPVNSFGGDDGEARLMRLAIEFDAVLAAETRCRHRYELVLAPGPGGGRVVHREALLHAPGRRLRRLFERQDSVVHGSGEFALKDADVRLGSVRPNASVISTLAQYNHALSLDIRQGLEMVLTNNFFLWREPLQPERATLLYAADPDCLDRLNALLPTLDIGVTGVRIEQGSGGPTALFVHAGLKEALRLQFESGGTRLFFALYPLLDRVLQNGGLAVIDEMDTELHPLVLIEILRLFSDPGRNPHGAQLITACQNPYPLDHLDKAEVWFTEKDFAGRTRLYGLRHIEGVRRGDNFTRKYLGGMFGAIPQFG
jgi:energy-coupling factor transporter ATP-binding protein EcfA2